MTQITDLPIDVWSRVFSHISFQQAPQTFDAVVYARALNVRLAERLSTFWMVMCSCQQSAQVEGDVVEDHGHHATFRYLLEMGISKDNAADLVRRSNGDLFESLLYMGWV